MLHPKWFQWKYKNTTLLALSIVLLIIFADHAIVRGIISGISGLHYLGIFFAGMFFVSTFTIFPATLLLAEMSKVYGFWEVTIFATLGAILGDYIIFRFIKDTVMEELAPVWENLSKDQHIYRLFHSPLFAWLLPVIGAVIIISPLPDELGLSILGISKLSNRRFIALVGILDLIGIMLLVSILRTL